MAIELKIRVYGDESLRKPSVPVKEITVGQRMIIKAMVEKMYQGQGIGLAAPQIGINERFLVADIGDGPLAVINPIIMGIL